MPAGRRRQVASGGPPLKVRVGNVYSDKSVPRPLVTHAGRRPAGTQRLPGPSYCNPPCNPPQACPASPLPPQPGYWHTRGRELLCAKPWQRCLQQTAHQGGAHIAVEPQVYIGFMIHKGFRLPFLLLKPHNDLVRSHDCPRICLHTFHHPIHICLQNILHLHRLHHRDLHTTALRRTSITVESRRHVAGLAGSPHPLGSLTALAAQPR